MKNAYINDLSGNRKEFIVEIDSEVVFQEIFDLNSPEGITAYQDALAEHIGGRPDDR